MKRNRLRISFLALAVGLLAAGFTSKKGVDLSHYQLDGEELCFYVPTQEEVKPVETTGIRYELFLGKTYVGFKEALPGLQKNWALMDGCYVTYTQDGLPS